MVRVEKKRKIKCIITPKIKRTQDTVTGISVLMFDIGSNYVPRLTLTSNSSASAS